MIQITIPPGEIFVEETAEFITNKQSVTLTLEHSLMSISKWEAKWHVPFLDSPTFGTKVEKTAEQILDYIKCMTLTQNVKDETYMFLTQENIKDITDYIDNPMTAKKFYGNPQKSSKKEVITSDLIYYWMIQFNIPSEYQKWHINRLLTLIRICSIKNGPKKKISARERAEQMRELNEKRKQTMNTKG